jgi:hypothetical protein
MTSQYGTGVSRTPAIVFVISSVLTYFYFSAIKNHCRSSNATPYSYLEVKKRENGRVLNNGMGQIRD